MQSSKSISITTPLPVDSPFTNLSTKPSKQLASPEIPTLLNLMDIPLTIVLSALQKLKGSDSEKVFGQWEERRRKNVKQGKDAVMLDAYVLKTSEIKDMISLLKSKMKMK